jgi:hypothetical protein
MYDLNDILTPRELHDIIVDDVHHGHDSLLAGADFSSIRAAIDDVYGPHRYDIADRMLDSLERRGREWEEPPTYEDVMLPSTKFKAVFHDLGKFNRDANLRGEPFGRPSACLHGHPWPQYLVHLGAGRSYCSRCSVLSARRSYQRHKVVT